LAQQVCPGGVSFLVQLLQIDKEAALRAAGGGSVVFKVVLSILLARVLWRFFLERNQNWFLDVFNG
jgi:hypothetical protein